MGVEASGELSPWPVVREGLEHPIADRNLAEAVDTGDYELLADELPWDTWYDKDEKSAILTSSLTRVAPARRIAHRAPDNLLQRLRLLGLTGPARRRDPHRPGYKY